MADQENVTMSNFGAMDIKDLSQARRVVHQLRMSNYELKQQLATPLAPTPAAAEGQAEAIGHVVACEDYGRTIKWANAMPRVGAALYAAPLPRQAAVLGETNAAWLKLQALVNPHKNDPHLAHTWDDAIIQAMRAVDGKRAPATTEKEI